MERDGNWIEDTAGIVHLAREGPDGPEKDDAKLVSLVIPIFNEERSIVPLCGEITDVLIGLQHSFEVIFVDDGSSDGSWEVLRDLALMELSIKAIRPRRNYGQTAAMMAGERNRKKAP